MSDESHVSCRSCRESIIKGASVCPHCRSQQNRSFGQLFADWVKWAAGVAAFITLLLSASELNKLIQLRLEKEHAVDEYIAAAKLLAESGDNVMSMKLIEDASGLNPSSAQIRNLKIELAQEKLRTMLLLVRNSNPYVMKKVRLKNGIEVFDFEYTYQEKDLKDFENLQVAELIKLFARGIVSLQGEDKATLIAHLGWLNTLRNSGESKYGVERHFVDALQIDPDNYYANAMYGAWLLSSINNTELEIGERIAQARKYFEIALAAPENSWAKAVWLTALNLSGDVSGQYELLRVLQEFKDQGESFYESGPARSAFLGNFAPGRSGGQFDDRDEAQLQALFSKFEEDDLLAKISWLSELIYGCSPGAGCEMDAGVLFVVGRLYERKNDLIKAIEAYRLTQIERGLLFYVSRKFLYEALKKQHRNPRNVLVCRNVRSAEIKENDILIEYHGKNYPSHADVELLNKNFTKDQTVNVQLLREGQILDRQSESLWQNDFTEYIVPESLLQEGKADELRRWLANDGEVDSDLF